MAKKCASYKLHELIEVITHEKPLNWELLAKLDRFIVGIYA
jgi:hypothetical protein